MSGIVDRFRANTFAKSYIRDGYLYRRQPDGSWPRVGDYNGVKGFQITFGSNEFNGSGAQLGDRGISNLGSNAKLPTQSASSIGVITGNRAKTEPLAVKASDDQKLKRIFDVYTNAVKALDDQYTRSDYVNRTRQTLTFYAKARSLILQRLWSELLVQGPQAASSLVNGISQNVLKSQNVDPFYIRRIDLVAPPAEDQVFQKAIDSLPYTMGGFSMALALDGNDVPLKTARR